MASRLVTTACSVCFKRNGDVRICSRCKTTAYCSKTCQAEDWRKSHKDDCEKLAMLRTKQESKEMPEMTSMGAEHLIKICKVCLKRSDDIQLCTGCKQVAYCSKDCQITDWQEGHENICGEVDSSQEESSDICCSFCQNISNNTQTCQGCLSVQYCDVVCQKSHWKQHKARCKEVNAANNDCVASLLYSEYFGGLPKPANAFIAVARPDESCYKKIKRAAGKSFPSCKVIENLKNVPWEPLFEITQSRAEYVLLAFIPRYHRFTNNNCVYLTDIEGNEAYVGFYMPRQVRGFVCKDASPGNFICIQNAKFHRFLDGTIGFRINDSKDFHIIKSSDYSA